MKMKKVLDIEGRKSFVHLGLIAIAGAALSRFLPKIRKSKSASGKKIKMLTASGKLVEVDAAFIKKRKKVLIDR